VSSYKLPYGIERNKRGVRPFQEYFIVLDFWTCRNAGFFWMIDCGKTVDFKHIFIYNIVSLVGREI
jgi:hypothetical protein